MTHDAAVLKTQEIASGVLAPSAAARIDDLVDHLERPRETTILRVLESKAADGRRSARVHRQGAVGNAGVLKSGSS